MKIHRRHFLQATTSFAASSAIAPCARAETYPTRPVHVIVGFPAGGAADISARLLSQWLTKRLGQQFVVESRPGAATNIATEAVARAPADGYTLLFVTQANAVNAALYRKLNFNFIRDIAPVASVLRVPGVMVVNPSFSATTVPEFIAYARSNPGKINMGSGGIGSAQHLYGELFKMLTGIEMVHIPYSGQPLTDLIGGRLQVVFNPVPSTISFIRSGKLRALAVTTAMRLDALPDVPAIAESVQGYEASGWFGIGSPKATPVPIVERLNAEINAALKDSKIKAQIAELGSTVFAGSPADFGKFIVDETRKWGTVVKSAGLKPV